MPNQGELLATFLRQQPVSNEQRADLWDAFQSSGTPDQLTERLNAMGSVPKHVKAALWDFKAMKTPTMPASPDDYTDTPKDRGVLDSALAFGSSFVKGLNPLPALQAVTAPGRAATGRELEQAQQAYGKGNYGQALGHALLAANPLTALQADAVALGKGVAAAQGEQLAKARDAYQQGRYSEAVGHAAAGALPLIGPAAAHAGEQIGSGNIAEGAGEAAALLVPFGAKYAGEVTRTGTLLPGAADVRRAAAQAAWAPANRQALGLPATPPLTATQRAVQAVTQLGRHPDPEMRAAIEQGLDQGLPINAAMASGSWLGHATQDLLEKTTPGGSVAARGIQQQARQGIERVAGEMAERAAPGVVTSPEVAGRGVRGAINTKVDQLNAQANRAYAALRTMEGEPGAAREVPAPPAPPAPKVGAIDRFAPVGATAEDIAFQVHNDARRMGYEGTKAELDDLFRDRVGLARDYIEEMRQLEQSNGRGRDLLEAVARLGGLRPDKGGAWGGEIAHLWESADWTNRGTRWSGKIKKGYAPGGSYQTGRYGGVPGVLAKLGSGAGRSADEIATWLSRDEPERFGYLTGPDDLIAAIEAAPKVMNQSHVPDLEEALRTVGGVKPGTRWWEGVGDTSFDTAALEAEGGAAAGGGVTPGTVRMPMPVDLRAAKEMLRPLAAQLRRPMTVADVENSRALKTIENILNEPDHAPLSRVDQDLGVLKNFQREATGGLEGHVYNKAVDAIHQAVDEAARASGPEAMRALAAGRAATRAKYEAIDTLAGTPRQVTARGVTPGRAALASEPVDAFRQLVAERDTNIDQLRAIAKQAPERIPEVGRAWLQEILSRGQEKGELLGPGGSQMFREWEKVGPATKTILFKDPELIRQLDRFFLVAKRMGEVANPSKTGYLVGGMGQLALGWSNPALAVALQPGAYALTRLMYNPAFVRLLTRGMTMPATNRAGQALIASQLARLAGDAAASQQPRQQQ